MPMHDWTRVKAGTYHNFHVLWMSSITNRLNAGLLPPDYFAMAEQIIGQPETDVVALRLGRRSEVPHQGNGGVAIAPVRPKTRFIMPVPPDQERYVRKTNRIVVRHELGDVAAVVEIVSLGNKDREHSCRNFVNKAVDLLHQQVNLLIIDPFPPGPHDPQGIHGEIWSELSDQPFALPANQVLTLASYQAAPIKTAYVETIAVGDRLPDMPLFLHQEFGIYVPLEETYQTTWQVLPAALRQLVELPTTS